MNKVCLASVCLNAVLLGVVGFSLFRPSPAASPEERFINTYPPAEDVPVRSAASAPNVEPVVAARPMVPSVDGLEPDARVAAFVEAGWSEEDAKVFVLGQVMREGLAFMVNQNGSRGEEYWKQQTWPEMDWEEQRKMVLHQQRMQEVVEDLFGTPMPGMFGGANIPLPREKVRAAAMVQRDYEMMKMKLHWDTNGVMLEEDQQALALLEEEMRNDLKAILTPEELFEFDIRTSGTAMHLRNRLQSMEPTEEEYREIFRLQHELDLQGGNRLTGADEEAHQRLSEEREEMEGKLREVLGEDRFRLYQRSQDWEYGRLVNVVKRLDLPRERVDKVYDLKEYAEKQRQELQGSSDLSPEEREAALEKFGQETREDLKALLGERGLDVYQRHGGGQWTSQLP